MKGLFIGLTTIDIIHYVTAEPEANEKISAADTKVFTGGPAANAAVAFSKLGGKAELVSPAGDSIFTSIAQKELDAYSVRLHNFSRHTGSDPVIASVIVNTLTGNRTVVGVKPQAEEPEPCFETPSIIPDVVLIDTYFNGTAKKYLEWARGHNALVVLDGGSWKPTLDIVLPYVDYAICSEDFRAPGCTAQSETALYLHDFGIETLCFTRGEKPIHVYEQGRGMKEFPVERVLQVTDTLGAGDIFHGAFCFYIVQTRMDFFESLASAAKTAASSIQSFGPRDW